MPKFKLYTSKVYTRIYQVEAKDAAEAEHIFDTVDDLEPMKVENSFDEELLYKIVQEAQ